MTTESLYLEGEERFGPVFSYLYGLGSVLLNRYYGIIEADLAAKKFDSLLDVGCGNGALIGRLANSFKSASFYGLDPSPHMLKRAEKLVSRRGLERRVDIKIGSSRSIPFDTKFDAIISSFSYHHWVNRDSSLLSLIPYLNDNGFVSIYEYDNSNKKFASSHGVEESQWSSLEVKGLKKTIIHKDGLIILTLSK